MELALVLPLCITLTLGCVDFARVIHAQIALSNATRVGADYGATHRFSDQTRSAWDARLRQIVEEEALSIPSFAASQFQMDVNTVDTPSGQQIVHVTCHYNFQTAVSWPALPSTIALRQHVAMRQYQ